SANAQRGRSSTRSRSVLGLDQVDVDKEGPAGDDRQHVGGPSGHAAACDLFGRAALDERDRGRSGHKPGGRRGGGLDGRKRRRRGPLDRPYLREHGKSVDRLLVLGLLTVYAGIDRLAVVFVLGVLAVDTRVLDHRRDMVTATSVIFLLGGAGMPVTIQRAR